MKIEMDYYMRDNCQLCSEGLLQINLALQELRDVELNLKQFNIDEDDQLQEEYMVRVPFLAHKGHVDRKSVV